MMTRTAIALGLAIAASTGFAAQGNSGADVGVNAGVNAAGGQASVDAGGAADTRFSALDRNGDGVLSRAEASASQAVSHIYDSLDTSNTIEDSAGQRTPQGITREQFQAGMQARSSASGSVGPAVSGGETYTIMRDGTRKLKENAGNTADRVQSQADNAVSGAVGGVTGAATGGASADTRTNANTSANVNANTRNEAAIQRERAQNKTQQMQNRARGGADQARSKAEMQRDRARDKAATIQERARSQGTETYGQSRSRGDDAPGSNGMSRESGGYGAGASTDADARLNTN